MRDLHPQIEAAGLTLAGISPQGPDSHARFSEKHRLTFPLLCDLDRTVIRMYDVLGPLGLGVRRATYLIDPTRRIEDAVLADLRLERHQDFVNRAIALSARGR